MFFDDLPFIEPTIKMLSYYFLPPKPGVFNHMISLHNLWSYKPIKTKFKSIYSQLWWCMPAVPALVSLRQEDHCKLKPAWAIQRDLVSVTRERIYKAVWPGQNNELIKIFLNYSSSECPFSVLIDFAIIICHLSHFLCLLQPYSSFLKFCLSQIMWNI